jgi:hypothetical protein
VDHVALTGTSTGRVAVIYGYVELPTVMNYDVGFTVSAA